MFFSRSGSRVRLSGLYSRVQSSNIHISDCFQLTPGLLRAIRAADFSSCLPRVIVMAKNLRDE